MRKYVKGENRYYVVDNEKEVAEVTFSVAEDTMLIIDHTSVSENYRGQGIAEALIKLVVEQAMKENKKIIPLCPFAARVFDLNPEYQKVRK